MVPRVLDAIMAFATSPRNSKFCEVQGASEGQMRPSKDFEKGIKQASPSLKQKILRDPLEARFERTSIWKAQRVELHCAWEGVSLGGHPWLCNMQATKGMLIIFLRVERPSTCMQIALAQSTSTETHLGPN